MCRKAAGGLAETDFPAWSALYMKFDAQPIPSPSVRTPNGPLADIMAAGSGTRAYEPSRAKAPVRIVRGEGDSLCKAHLRHLESGSTAL